MLNQKEVKSLLKSYMQIEKEADIIKQKHQRLAMKIPNIGPRPKSAKKQPEVALKNEITELKQRRLQLEQESSKLSNEFDYMKKIIQSDLKQQLGNQNHREQEILNNLDQVANETKINYQKFRLGKFINKINTIFVANQEHYLNECYNKLKTVYISSNSLQQKFIQFRQFSLKKKCLSAWKEIVYQIIQENKQKENEIQSRYQMEQNQLALEFRNFFLKNRTFKIWIKFVNTQRLTKHFDQNQTNIKVKVNQFLSEMQQQIVQQISKEKEQIEELKQSYESNEEINDQIQEDYSVSISDESLELTEEQAQLIIQPTELYPIPIQNQQQYQQQQQQQQQQEQTQEKQKQKQKSQKNMSSPPPLPPKQVGNPWKQNNGVENELPEDLIKIIEENRQSIEISHNRPSVASLQSNDTRKQSSVERKNIIAKELDEKAKKRKEMNEAIKKKHEEKRQQQELQKQQQEQQRQLENKKRKEEEYKRLQDKKKQEQEQQLRQQQLKFEEEYKMDLAMRHYEKSLQKYQIFIPIVKNWLKLNEKEQKANEIFQKILKFRFLNLLKLNFKLTQEEREQEETIKMNIANSHYKIRLSRKVIRCLIEQVKIMGNREQEAINVRKQYLVRRIMTGWYIELPDLRAENLKLDRISGRLVNDFRKAILQRTFFKEWRKCVQEQIAERNKVQHKEEMWSKVNQWLQEFDQENS